MDIERISKFAFLASATYILLCIPAIFLAEHFALKQSPIHGTQSLAVTLCLPASLVFLWCSRSRAFKPIHWLAVAAVVLSALWLSFIGYFIFGPHDFGPD
jgi:hypothetical protein